MNAQGAGHLTLVRAGPALSLQDLGRPGHIAQGLSVGGAADRLALIEAAALLGLKSVAPALEMAGMGGVFTVSIPVRIALTGAQMRADIDGDAVVWNAVHVLRPGQTLTLGGVVGGTYAYLTCAGGIAAPRWLDSVSAHMAAGIGSRLESGAELSIGADNSLETSAMHLPPDNRFAGGTVRLMPGPQTGLFTEAERRRFEETVFHKGAQANRQGAKLSHTGAPFKSDAAAGLASDFIVPGDVQMTGAGVPFVLLSECQTIGGYPRIGTVIGPDLPRVAQAPAGAELRFSFLGVDEADALYRDEAALLSAMRRRVSPLVRDPRRPGALFGIQLISGAVRGDE